MRLVFARGKNKTWLISLLGNIDDILTHDYRINIDMVLDTDKENFAHSNDAKELKKIWFKENAAIHDVTAYLYIRKKRKSDPNKKLLQKAKYWFISANERLYDFNLSKVKSGNTSEIIMPGALTSLLFLQNPKKLSDRVSSIGLNELIAQTLTEEYPSRDLINEFDAAINEKRCVSDDDYSILISAVSQESTGNIHKLVNTSKNDPEKFKQDISTLIEKERNRKNQSAKKFSEEKENNEKLTKELSNISNELKKINEQHEKEKRSNSRKKTILYFIYNISYMHNYILGFS